MSRDNEEAATDTTMRSFSLWFYCLWDRFFLRTILFLETVEETKFDELDGDSVKCLEGNSHNFGKKPFNVFLTLCNASLLILTLRTEIRTPPFKFLLQPWYETAVSGADMEPMWTPQLLGLDDAGVTGMRVLTSCGAGTRWCNWPMMISMDLSATSNITSKPAFLGLSCSMNYWFFLRQSFSL